MQKIRNGVSFYVKLFRPLPLILLPIDDVNSVCYSWITILNNVIGFLNKKKPNTFILRRETFLIQTKLGKTKKKTKSGKVEIKKIWKMLRNISKLEKNLNFNLGIDSISEGSWSTSPFSNYKLLLKTLEISPFRCVNIYLRVALI